MLGHWQETLPRLLLAATSGLRRFDAFTRELVGFFTENPDRARLLMREALDSPRELREAILAHVTPWVKAICDNIRTGQEQGSIREDVDPEAYVTLVVNLVIGGVATWDTVESIVGRGDSNPEGANEGMARHIAELLRIARASLFVDRPAAAGRPEIEQHSMDGR